MRLFRATRRAPVRALFVVAVMLPVVVVPASPAAAAPGDVSTLAGGPVESGTGTSIAQVPEALTFRGGLVYISDSAGGFTSVKTLDPATGVEEMVAGNGTSATGTAGDGGLATLASVANPSQTAFDGAGNMFVAQQLSYKVRRVDASTAIITTVAGTGASGFSGDGGPATAATLNQPKGIAVDSAGNLFIADKNNHRVRLVNLGAVPVTVYGVTVAPGNIATVVGTGTAGYNGDGIAATTAQLNEPGTLGFDSTGNLLIADEKNLRLRRVSAAGTITTIAGTGVGTTDTGDGGLATAATLGVAIGCVGCGAPSGFVVDAADNVFLTGGGRIRKITAATGIIDTVAGNGAGGFGGDGAAASAAAMDPVGVTVDGAGNLYISGNLRLRRVDAATQTISTVAGNGQVSTSGDGGPASQAQVNSVQDLTTDAAGNVYFVQGAEPAVRRIDAVTGVVTRVAGNAVLQGGFAGDGGPATAATMSAAMGGFGLDGSGNLFLAQVGNNRVSFVNRTAGPITRYGITVASGNIDTVAGNGTGGFAGDGGPATSATVSPSDAAVDAAGMLYIASGGSRCVRRVDPATGIITTYAGQCGTAAAFSGDGGPATAARLTTPGSIVVDAAGNLVIRDGTRIRKVTAATGIISTIFGLGTSFGDGGPAIEAAPATLGGLGLDNLSRLFFVSGNSRIRMIDTDGTVYSVAGTGVTIPTGTVGTLGDGGPALQAQMNPIGVTVDPAGNVFFGQSITNSHRSIRKVSAPVPLGGIGLFHPLTPTRILDTRASEGPIGTCTPSPCNKVAAGTPRTIQVAGLGGVPATGVTSVVLNVTVTGPSADSFLTVWPSDATEPNASNLNFVANQTVPNLVTVKLGATGAVKISNSTGDTHVIADVAGWYGNAHVAAAGSRFSSLTPARLLDTRAGINTGVCTPSPCATVAAGAPVEVQVTGQGGVPATGVTAVVMNVTVTGPSADSFLTVWPADASQPNASNLNFVANQTVPNLVVVKLSPTGTVKIAHAAGSTDVIADVAGYYGDAGAAAGSRLLPLTPARVLDTRAGINTGTCTPSPCATVQSGAPVEVQIAGRGGVPATGVTAVVMNVTVTSPSAGSFLTVWPADAAEPNASNLNFSAGQTVPNLVTVKLSPTGTVKISNFTGSTEVIADVAGWYDDGGA